MFKSATDGDGAPNDALELLTEYIGKVWIHNTLSVPIGAGGLYEGIFVDVTAIATWRLNFGGTGSLPKL